jgi:ATP-dependent exoDNAse (exonuclease V) beta subunit
MSHAGVVDHTQTSLAALAALGTEFEPTDLALQLDYRIRHILIDEFQDTSSMQYSLLKQLTAGWADGDGRTLFIVGDGMQSCYSFRNANVTLFLRAREQVEHVKMELLLLQVNFRSTASVVSWVNAVFSGAFPQENDLIRGGVSYSHSAASDPASSSAGVSCRLFVQPDENFDKQAQRRHEAEAVARLCLELQQQHPGERIAILVRNRGNLADIVPALRRAGLSWNAEEIDPLLSYPAVNDLFTLLRALLDPADVTAGLALLRCPFIGIGLQDLELLAQQRTGQNCTLFETLSAWDAVPALSDAARTRLQRSVPHLQTALTLRQTLPLAELLENLWLELGGPACNEDNSVLDNIATFFRLVHTHSEAGDIPDLQHFEIQLQRCYGSARNSTVQLQIMTIHKAKGLEFEHVILPGLERQGRSNSSELLYWQEYIDQQQITRPLLGLMTSKGDEADLLYRYLRKEAGLREKLETGRLLYIAATRAIKSAWLFGCVKKNKMGYSAPANSLLHTILEQLQAERETLQVQFEDLVAGIQGSSTSMLLPVTQSFRRLPLSWQNPLQGRTLPPLQAVTSDSIDTVTHDVLAAAVGELVHLGLQQLVLQGPDWLHTKRFSALCARKLRPLCASFQELQQASLKVHNQLHNCLAAPEAQWLFHTRHQDDACELALTDYRGRYRKDYTIDRTFIDAEGVRWIIDYKSSTPAAGQSREVFLQEHTTRYRSQLETYASLLQQPGAAVPVKLALYFTALPTLHFLQKS